MHVVERGAPVHYGGGAEAVYMHARLIRSVTHGHIHANGGLLTYAWECMAGNWHSNPNPDSDRLSALCLWRGPPVIGAITC